ncbi:serine hydrolase domain-containing protein [Ruminiclostridium cellulolyticum]|uniref:Beta-lactamase n=1 Tax=Ruminiclostridium cellulolyticum (strain ATCC 35319 / DSM 5812 / JCM 6584 / H10) TaxID=394503 RepID=B8I688_RUMCH|nr:serine hydrolase domain-containing protein [Ruminiclostridium cellulolyticum]ACL76853.1 beta-lactamase [Ruminiclostridium cellulolyticum H10]
MNKAILKDYLDSLESKGVPGCDCVIFHKHKPVFRHTTGFADAGKTKHLTSENLFWLFSATKLITCTAIMQLVEKGKVSLDAPVADYLPEYKHLNVKCGSEVVPAKNTLTIRHLLSMQSGLNYNLQASSILKVLEDTEYEATTRQVIRALANEPLEFEPGTHFLYSLSHDVLGAVIEEVSGQKFGEYLEEHILKPLGMKNTGFELTPDRKANMSEQFEYDMDTMTSKPISLANCYKLSSKYESGGAGLLSTADDYILFLDAMCNDGVSADGYRVLTRESIDMMRKDQMNDISKKDFDEFGRIGYSYGLGVRTLVEKERSGVKSPLGEFGWDGAAGAYALIDVKNRLAIFYVQHVRGCGYAYSDIHPKIRDLSYEMLDL